MTFALILKSADDLAAESLADWRAQVSTAVEAQVESRARAQGYSGAAQLASYAASTVPDWVAEAKAFVAWRDAVWLEVQVLLTESSARKPLPSPEALVAQLPPWRG